MRSIIVAATATVILFSSPALTQQPEQGVASITDFSGTWSRPYVCGFEPPPSGPGPVVNKLRRRQIFDADHRALSPTKAPLIASIEARAPTEWKQAITSGTVLCVPPLRRSPTDARSAA